MQARVGEFPVSAPLQKKSRARSLRRTDVWIAAALLAQVGVAAAQQQPLSPGEAVVTRFPGTTSVPGPGGAPLTLINPGGAVATVIDLRNPNRAPQGQQWFDKPQRHVAYAADTGLVFGTALDNLAQPNIYLTATAAFGLHRLPGNAQWMPGMWGAGGGPGTVYKLDAQNGYQAQPFAEIRLTGRPNSGAALGNITFDRWNRQLFVSDFETGMIHRIRATDGADLGFYDHGVQGRPNFLDASSGQRMSLPPIPFNLASRARINDCPDGEFQYSPSCWNIAANGRRVWGLAVGRLAPGGEVRLYYSVSSSPEFDPNGWNALSNEEKRNSVWSVRIAPGGAFDPSSVRREFIVPDFFVDPQDIARAGYSRPVSDIAFPGITGHPVMLLAERGGVRNFGLEQPDSFATPHESRALRYELYQDGVWRPVGRYDVGSYYRFAEGPPRLLANSAGGISFGYGFTPNWTFDRERPDETVWITGDSLCSPNGPCNLVGQTGTQAQADPSEVHGVQGMRHGALAELAPAAAFAPADPSTPADTQSIGLDQSFLIDANASFDDQGQPIAEEFTRNDATRVGDIAIFEASPAPTAPPLAGFVPVLPPPPVIIYEPGHSAIESHLRFSSHSTSISHFRYGSHWPVMSHNRWGSHSPPGSWKHWPPGSWVHLPPGSVHIPPGSVKHEPPGSKHFPPGSKHFPVGSAHFPPGSLKGHILPDSPKHNPPGSKHFPPGSEKAHILPDSPKHLPPGSKHFPPGSLKAHLLPDSPKHNPPGSVKEHFPPGSLKAHILPDSPKHNPPGSVKEHFPPGSLKAHILPDSPKHNPPGSVKEHFPPGSLKAHILPDSPKHNPPGSVKEHFPPGSLKAHILPDSPKHNPPGSVKEHFPPGSLKAHILPDSPKHNPPGSVHVPAGSVKVLTPKDIGPIQKDIGPPKAEPKEPGTSKTLAPKDFPKTIVQPKEIVPPKTQAPKTVEPKTLAPKTTQPKTIQPKTIQPKPTQPTTVQPKTVQPKTEPKQESGDDKKKFDLRRIFKRQDGN